MMHADHNICTQSVSSWSYTVVITQLRDVCAGLWCLGSKFESISESATKEYNLERAMDKMKAEWKDMVFNIVPYR